MVIARSPLRITLAGGGTDIPSWYEQYGSIFLSAAINKYIFTTLHRSKYNPHIRLRYSRMEEVEKAEELQNEIARATLQEYLYGDPVEITTHAEIPANTGLGSSGAFGVGLLHVFHPRWGKDTLAEQATRIQMEVLKYPVGKQDQYVAAYGGVRLYSIDYDGDVVVSPFLEKGQLDRLAEKLVLFYTGLRRDTNEVLRESSTDGLKEIVEISRKMIEALKKEQFDTYGQLLNEHWHHKKRRGKITNEFIDDWYELGITHGALGGKIVGAGGGGFLLFYTNDRQRLINAMPMMHQDFSFDYDGSKIIYENIS